jgi:cold shock CspA family protein
MAGPFKKGNADVATGTAKWFNEAKGDGFIIPDEGGPAVFVHATAVKRPAMTFCLKERT